MTEGRAKITIPRLLKKKGAGEKIVMVTCYDATFARLVEQAGVDVVLVGDSLGMVIQGQKTTLPVTLDEMIYHTRAVSRGLKTPLLVADMPFMTYQASEAEGAKNAGALMKRGEAQSVKIEGGHEVVPLVGKLVRAGVPVMGHIGLQPQSIHKYGGYKIQGKGAADERRLLAEARALEEAGCWSIVLEGIPLEVAEKITRSLKIPTIGIASGPHCDGQVLVIYDLLGMDAEFRPRFARRYAELSETIPAAVGEFAREVREGTFPTEAESFRRDLVEINSRPRSSKGR